MLALRLGLRQPFCTQLAAVGPGVNDRGVPSRLSPPLKMRTKQADREALYHSGSHLFLGDKWSLVSILHNLGLLQWSPCWDGGLGINFLDSPAVFWGFPWWLRG